MHRGWIGKLRSAILCRIRTLMLCTAVLVGALVCGSELLDEGEVVGLTTGGNEQQTDLWIVELGDAIYVRAGAPDVSWLGRLRKQPAVMLERGGSVRRFRAIPDEASATLENVNRAMADKYGLADTLWGHVSDRSHAVAIRLERLDASEELAGDDRNAN